MNHRISLVIVWLVLFIFSSNAYTFFLSPRKTLRKYFPLIYTAACILMAVILLLLPNRLVLYLSAFSAVAIIFPSFFFRGTLIERTVVTIIFYLSSMLSDMISALSGYIVQTLFTEVPVSGNIVLTGTPLSSHSANLKPERTLSLSSILVDIPAFSSSEAISFM